jgi:hypothetical protein
MGTQESPAWTRSPSAFPAPHPGGYVAPAEVDPSRARQYALANAAEVMRGVVTVKGITPAMAAGYTLAIAEQFERYLRGIDPDAKVEPAAEREQAGGVAPWGKPQGPIF